MRFVEKVTEAGQRGVQSGQTTLTVTEAEVTSYLNIAPQLAQVMQRAQGIENPEDLSQRQPLNLEGLDLEGLEIQNRALPWVLTDTLKTRGLPWGLTDTLKTQSRDPQKRRRPWVLTDTLKTLRRSTQNRALPWVLTDTLKTQSRDPQKRRRPWVLTDTLKTLRRSTQNRALSWVLTDTLTTENLDNRTLDVEALDDEALQRWIELARKREGLGKLRLPDPSPWLAIQEPQVYFKDSGQIILRGYGQVRNARHPLRLVVAPRASDGELVLDFVEGTLGPVALPETLFDVIGTGLSQVILAGQNWAEINEITVRQGVLTLGGRYDTEKIRNSPCTTC
jgi:hypothetical protein